MGQKQVRDKAMRLLRQRKRVVRTADNSLAISLDWVAKSKHFRILYDSELPTLARTHYIPDLGFWLIELLATASEAEQRMALAHELGHIYLGHTPTVSNRKLSVASYGYDGVDEFVHTFPPNFDRQEEEAQQFAAFLLVPAGIFREAAGFAWSREKIAEKLNVPLELVDLRFELL